MNTDPSENLEHATRHENAQQLIDDFNLESNAEFFADPEHRLAFMQSLTYEDFLSLARHVNGRMRDMDPREKQNYSDKGADVSSLGTPKGEEKPRALQQAYEEIHNFIQTSDDTAEQKLLAAGMATEAMIIWVHPFNDANGRTSRFFGKFFEDGTADLEALKSETSVTDNRQRVYYDGIRVDQWNMIKDNLHDLMYDDDEIEQMRKDSEMPVADGIQLSIHRLLNHKGLQQQLIEKARRSVAKRDAYLAQKALKLEDAHNFAIKEKPANRWMR